MKKGRLVRLVCIAVLSQYGLPAVSALAAENEESTLQTSNSEQLTKDPVLDNLPMTSREEITETEEEPETTGSSVEKTTAESTVESEEAKIFSWELKDPQQEITVGDDFVVKIKGTEPTAKLVLPEGLAYHAEKNVEELRSLIRFDKEKRELAISKIDEYDELELVLTTEKAGSYQLQMTNEAAEKLGDSLDLAVAEKAEAESSAKDEPKQENTPAEAEAKAVAKKESQKQPRADTADSRVTIGTTSGPSTEITNSGQRIVYATTISHTDSTRPINGGKLVLSITNGKFNSFPAVADYATTLKSSTLSTDGKTITLELKDGLASGNFVSYSYSAYAAVGVSEGADVSVNAIFTGKFAGESTTFTNTVEKKVSANLSGGGIKPITPGSSSWYLTNPSTTSLYPSVSKTGYWHLKNQDMTEGFTDLKVKMKFSDSTKVAWFSDLMKSYTIYYQGGGTKTIYLTSETLEKVNDQTYLVKIGEVNPEEIVDIVFSSNAYVPSEVTAGETFTLKLTAMEKDADIMNATTTYIVQGEETALNFTSSRSGSAVLAPGQTFSTAYTTTGVTTKEITDYTIEIPVEDKIIPKEVVNGTVTGTNPNIKNVEYYSETSWKIVPINGDGVFVFPDEAIEKIRVNYVPLSGTISNYQPFRVFWQVKEDAEAETTFMLKHQIAYTDAFGDLQKPDVSNRDLSYTIKADASQKTTRAGVFQYNRTKDFNSGAVLTGDTFRMNYRIGALDGTVEQPYVFVKVPKGIEVKNNQNTIQYPYGNDLAYTSAPANGKTGHLFLRQIMSENLRHQMEVLFITIKQTIQL